MTFVNAMNEAIKEAVESGHQCFVYERCGDFVVSHDYRNGWLFRAYPGGRKILSVAGKNIIETA